MYSLHCGVLHLILNSAYDSAYDSVFDLANGSPYDFANCIWRTVYRRSFKETVATGSEALAEKCSPT